MRRHRLMNRSRLSSFMEVSSTALEVTSFKMKVILERQGKGSIISHTALYKLSRLSIKVTSLSWDLLEAVLLAYPSHYHQVLISSTVHQMLSSEFPLCLLSHRLSAYQRTTSQFNLDCEKQEKCCFLTGK